MNQKILVKMIVRVHLDESPGIEKLSERYKSVFNMEGTPQIGLRIAIDSSGDDSVEIQELYFNQFETLIQYTAYSTWETLDEEEFHKVCKLFNPFWERKKK